MEAKFLKLTKANKAKDRLLIALDAICAVEEDRDGECVKICTIDGFWYEVVDSMDTIYSALANLPLPTCTSGIAQPMYYYTETTSPKPHKPHLKRFRSRRIPPVGKDTTREPSLDVFANNKREDSDV